MGVTARSRRKLGKEINKTGEGVAALPKRQSRWQGKQTREVVTYSAEGKKKEAREGDDNEGRIHFKVF